MASECHPETAGLFGTFLIISRLETIILDGFLLLSWVQSFH